MDQENVLTAEVFYDFSITWVCDKRMWQGSHLNKVLCWQDKQASPSTASLYTIWFTLKKTSCQKWFLLPNWMTLGYMYLHMVFSHDSEIGLNLEATVFIIYWQSVPFPHPVMFLYHWHSLQDGAQAPGCSILGAKLNYLLLVPWISLWKLPEYLLWWRNIWLTPSGHSLTLWTHHKI